MFLFFLFLRTINRFQNQEPNMPTYMLPNDVVNKLTIEHLKLVIQNNQNWGIEIDPNLQNPHFLFFIFKTSSFIACWANFSLPCSTPSKWQRLCPKTYNLVTESRHWPISFLIALFMPIGYSITFVSSFIFPSSYFVLIIYV